MGEQWQTLNFVTVVIPTPPFTGDKNRPFSWNLEIKELKIYYFSLKDALERTKNSLLDLQFRLCLSFLAHDPTLGWPPSCPEPWFPPLLCLIPFLLPGSLTHPPPLLHWPFSNTPFPLGLFPSYFIRDVSLVTSLADLIKPWPRRDLHNLANDLPNPLWLGLLYKCIVLNSPIRTN